MSIWTDLGAAAGSKFGKSGSSTGGAIGELVGDIVGGKFKNPKSKVIKVQDNAPQSEPDSAPNWPLVGGVLLVVGIGGYLLLRKRG